MKRRLEDRAGLLIPPKFLSLDEGLGFGSSTPQRRKFKLWNHGQESEWKKTETCHRGFSPRILHGLRRPRRAAE